MSIGVSAKGVHSPDREADTTLPIAFWDRHLPVKRMIHRNYLSAILKHQILKKPFWKFLCYFVHALCE